MISWPQVEDWVQDQANGLCEKTTCYSDRVEKTSESLWDNLKEAFEHSFTHTGQVKQAKSELNRLEMVQDQIDNYIAKFENLVCKAGIPHNKVGILEKFRDGLKKGIHGAIMRCDTWPENLDDWQEAAQREVWCFEIIKEALGKDRSNPFISTRQAKWQGLTKRALRPCQDDTALMDINKARTDAAKENH